MIFLPRLEEEKSKVQPRASSRVGVHLQYLHVVKLDTRVCLLCAQGGLCTETGIDLIPNSLIYKCLGTEQFFMIYYFKAIKSPVDRDPKNELTPYPA